MSKLQEWQALDDAGRVIDLRVGLHPYRRVVGPLAPQETAAEQALEVCKVTPCETAAQFGYFQTALIQCKTMSKGLDDKRRKLTGPINTAKREVDTWFMPTIKGYQKCEKVIKQKLAAYRNAAAARKLQAQQDIAQLHAAGDYAAVVQQSQHMVPPPTTQGVSYTTRHTYTVTDFSALPDAYKQVNESALRSQAKERPQIPGVQWVTVEVPTVRVAK